MSALAHMIELRGFPTTVVGLIRMHMEKSLPPRGVYVPFQLGRPFGEPGDAAFQRRVLVQALGLLERSDGPLILEDFNEQAPSWTDTPDWRAPFALPSPDVPDAPSGWAAALAREVHVVQPHWEVARQRFGRTTVGTSGMPPQAWGAYIGAFIEGRIPESPVPGLPAPALTLRYAVDDLKAFYTEAVQSAGPQPASRQVDRWFWNDTTAAGALQALRLASMESGHNAFKTVGGRFFVPAPFVKPKP